MLGNISRVYILTDDKNRVTCIEGEYSLPSDLTGWILIEEGPSCDRLNLAQVHYLDKPLMNDDGVYQYKYVNNRVTERTQEEMDADKPSIPDPEIPLEERISDLEIALCELLEVLS